MRQPPRRAVYTALFGSYEKLTEQPAARGSAVDLICFTDNPELTSETWDVRLVRDPLPGDPVRSCRILKIRGHADLADYDETLWIDNSVLLKADPVGLLDAWLEDCDFALPWHSYRRNLAAEFDAVALAGRDDPARVQEQLAVYTERVPHLLGAEVLWTGILARRPSPIVHQTMMIWLDHVLRYSRRDQLSLPFAVDAVGIEARVVELDNWESRWHRWPVTSGRPKEAEFEFEPRGLSSSQAAEIARLHSDIDELIVQYGEAVLMRERELVDIHSTRWWIARTVVWDRLRAARNSLRTSGERSSH